MTVIGIILRGALDGGAGLDAYLRKLYDVGKEMMASWACYFTDTTRRTIRVERIGNENFVNVYERPGEQWPGRPTISTPASLVVAIVDWDTKKTIWRRDRVTRQVMARRRPRKTLVQAGTYPSPATDQRRLF